MKLTALESFAHAGRVLLSGIEGVHRKQLPGLAKANGLMADLNRAVNEMREFVA